jgi:hypothetical protein
MPNSKYKTCLLCIYVNIYVNFKVHFSIKIRGGTFHTCVPLAAIITVTAKVVYIIRKATPEDIEEYNREQKIKYNI